jgi:hypothetical protein
MKIAGSGVGSGSGGQSYGSADPDPYQNVTDLQHCLALYTGTVHLPIFSSFIKSAIVGIFVLPL